MAIGQYLGLIGGIVGAIVGGVIGTLCFPVLGTGAGAAWGFTIGSMVGGIAGQVFWPEQAELNLPPPPQPHETRLQFSSWGAAIPIQYGSGRLAGNIIYMSDIVETIERSRHRQDGVRYYEMVKTYTATFAIAFCEGPVPGIARIWVNNKVFADFRSIDNYPIDDVGLLIGNVTTTIARSTVYFDIYYGDETQTYNSKIATLLTDSETPSYKGICYIVFKDFPIGEFSGVPNIEIEIGPSFGLEDFLEWIWVPRAEIQVASHEVYIISDKAIYGSGGPEITHAPARTWENFSFIFEMEILKLTPPLYPDAYNTAGLRMAASTPVYNNIEFVLNSTGAGVYKFCLRLTTNPPFLDQTDLSAPYTTLPLKRIIVINRNGTTVSAKIYNDGVLEETLSLTHASLIATNLLGPSFYTYFQTGNPAATFYVRNMLMLG